MKKLLVILIALMCSCSNSVKKELILLQSRPIIFPKNAKFSINGRDTTILNYFKSDIKVVVYADATACASCEVRYLELWKPYIDKARNTESLSYCFILAPEKKDSLSILASLKAYPIDHPVLLDYNQEFINLNTHLPQNKNFHTLVLDRDNTTVLVGNPIFNQNIRNMYKSTIDNMIENRGVYIPQ